QRTPAGSSRPASRTPFARTVERARSWQCPRGKRGSQTYVARNSSTRLRGRKKAPQYWSYDRKRNGGNAPAVGGLPFLGHPPILTDIVKQFTSNTSSDTTPHFAHVRRSPAM